MNEVYYNLLDTWERIEKAASKSGCDAGEIKLVAVSKNMGIKRIRSGIEAGISCLGENRVQEFLEKYDAIGNAVEWHFIGHLQSNKVKYIIDKVALIHSLDRDSLAEEINKRAGQKSIVSNVLVEVNVAEEESKHGLRCDEVLPFIKKVSDEYANISIKGLMTMAPLVEDTERTRGVFRKLRELSEMIGEREIKGVDMDYLSMGMTNDFEIAVEEGSNMVRIGRAIFGPRK